MSRPPDVSVLVVTREELPDRLRRAVEALGAQTGCGPLEVLVGEDERAHQAAGYPPT